MERQIATGILPSRRIGQSGLKVSVIGLGTWLGASNPDVFKQIVLTAYDQGIFHFDTADLYGPLPGWAESMLGNCLAGIRRSSYVLSTKVHARVGRWPNDEGLSRKHIIESCNSSLKRLKTDYIDIYYCHRYDEDTPLDETIDALATLKNQGKILYAGISMWSAHQIEAGVRLAKEARLQIVANQVLYNVLQRPSEDVLNICKREGIGLIAYSPLAQGVLTGKYLKSAKLINARAIFPHRNKWIQRILDDHLLMQSVRIFSDLCQQYGIPPVHAALSWLLEQDLVACALCGFSDRDQLSYNLAGAPFALPAELTGQINQIEYSVTV